MLLGSIRKGAGSEKERQESIQKKPDSLCVGLMLPSECLAHLRQGALRLMPTLSSSTVYSFCLKHSSADLII